MVNAHRVVVIGDNAATLSAAERLISAGMCVDLISARPAPFGLLRRFAGLTGVLEESIGSGCGPGSTPRLRLIGNVRVGGGPQADITHRELHQLAAHGDRELIILELKARGVPVTTWEGLCTPLDGPADPSLVDAPTDWHAIHSRAQLAPVCF